MKLKILGLGAFASFALFGCTSTATNNAPAGSAGSNTAAGGNNEPEETPAPVLPNELKTAAYEYYGLSDTSERMMTIKVSGKPDEAGTIQYKLVSVKDGVATFSATCTGALEREMGSGEFELSKDGLRASKNPKMKSVDGSLELPADCSPGKTWPFKAVTTSSPITITMEGTNKVVGTESVTTPVGTYKDALLVKTTATATQSDGKSFTLVSKGWFVKGRGNVRSELTQKQGNQSGTVILEESKEAN